jgi:hypothetical protein
VIAVGDPKPPTLGDWDYQTAEEEAWLDLQHSMTWAFDNQRSRQGTEDSIRRTTRIKQESHWPGFHGSNFVRGEPIAAILDAQSKFLYVIRRQTS